MKRILVALFPALLLLSCTPNSRPKQTLLLPGNLKSNIISLFADSAYRLQTPKGAIIKIEAGSFGVAINSKVKLEIKEAYSLNDILLAGLTTESNGRPLNSGGMIFINATANGKAIELLKPIKISIPTDVYDDRMQLFKGEIKEDSSINWVDPQPLDTGITAKNLAKGEALFKNSCASCHKLRKDFTGPALAGCRDREPDRDWAYRFTNNVNRMQETDPYARMLLAKYRSKMTQFNLEKDDIKAILDFCDNEASLDPQAIPANTVPLEDTVKATKPCGYDTIYYAKKDSSIILLPPDTLNYVIPDLNFNKNKEEEYKEGLRGGFSDGNKTNGMYDFEIKTFGWYNIDFLFEGYTGSTFVTITAALQMPLESDMHVYLFCPGKKFLSVAYGHTGNNYLFDKGNGKIPLFLNDDAIILAFGSKADKILYGTASFKIKNEQTINIQVKETTEADLKSFILKNNIDGIEIDLNKKEDFKIKEKPCDDVITDSVSVVKK